MQFQLILHFFFMGWISIHHNAKLCVTSFYAVQTELSQILRYIFGFRPNTKSEKFFPAYGINTKHPIEFVALTFITFYLWAGIALSPSIEQAGAIIYCKLIEEYNLFVFMYCF